MTGTEFNKALKDAGYNQTSFAQLMGVHRTTIVAKCSAEKVEPYWVYALAGLVAAKSSSDVRHLVKMVN